MEAFGIIGMGVAATALAKISKLEERLKEKGVLDKEFESG